MAVPISIFNSSRSEHLVLQYFTLVTVCLLSSFLYPFSHSVPCCTWIKRSSYPSMFVATKEPSSSLSSSSSSSALLLDTSSSLKTEWYKMSIRFMYITKTIDTILPSSQVPLIPIYHFHQQNRGSSRHPHKRSKSISLRILWVLQGMIKMMAVMAFKAVAREAGMLMMPKHLENGEFIVKKPFLWSKEIKNFAQESTANWISSLNRTLDRQQLAVYTKHVFCYWDIIEPKSYLQAQMQRWLRN